MMDEMGRYDSRRPCRVCNSEMTKTENGYFHLWFIPQDGWPKALVELENGKMICVNYKKIIFD